VAGEVSDVSVFAALSQSRVLPVAVVDDRRSAGPLAASLLEGGLRVAEVTLRTAVATEVIRDMADAGGLLVGAGTVVRPEQVQLVVDAGACFVVTPGFSAAVVRECQTLGVPVIPGIATPTELQMALDAGVDTVKFFPAVAAGGVPMIRAMSAPYRDARFVPTGGITAANAGSFLAVPEVLAVGGSWMVASDLLAEGHFGRVTALCAEAAALAGTAPGAA
jgi:2-dehydro-3-deoxyphosphogluconate aldolase/(4S)-4-hydroxy-2-oxoglutarate aldolase